MSGRTKAWLLAGAAAAVSPFVAAPGFAQAQVVDELVVTAQRREEQLNEVPAAVTAISGANLIRQGATGVRDLTSVIPALNVSTNGRTFQPTIRGVGTRGVSAGDESNVPIFIDGIYQPVMQANFFDFADVQRVEVVKGPQGTLFGRNAVGGTINVVTADPTPDFVLRAGLSYGSYDQRIADLFVAGPLAEGLSGSLSVHASRDDGYVKDIVQNINLAKASSAGVRGKLLWRPTDFYELKVVASYLNAQDNTIASGNALNGNTIARRTVPNVVTGGGLNSALSFPPYNRIYFWSGAVTHTIHFKGFDLSSTTSYQRTRNPTLQDSDVTPAPIVRLTYEQATRTVMEEIRATSTGEGPLKWIAGVFYYRDKAGQPYQFNNATFLRSQQGSEAYAVFGEATYSLSDQLSVTGGLRYSHEKRDVLVLTNTTLLPRAEATSSKVTPRLTVQYKFNDDHNVYATYSEGFKSAVFNSGTTVPPLRAVRPEQLKAWQAGYKGMFGRLFVTADTYYYKYKDLQISARDPSGSGTTFQNAGAAELYGAELEFNLPVTEDFRLHGGTSWQHAQYTDFTGASIVVPRPGNDGNTSSFIDATGSDLIRTPHHTYNISASYGHDLEVGRLEASAVLFWTGSSLWENSGRVKQPSYELLNGQIGWVSPNGQFRVTLWGKNLTDSRYYQAAVISTNADNVNYARPRTYGVRLNYELQ